jgi:hypothetical protein
MMTSKAQTPPSPSPTPQTPNKLYNGPCANIMETLEDCAKRKGVGIGSGTSKPQNTNLYREKLQACPNETDQLIKCMNKNPKHFY